MSAERLFVKKYRVSIIVGNGSIFEASQVFDSYKAASDYLEEQRKVINIKHGVITEIDPNKLKWMKL